MKNKLYKKIDDRTAQIGVIGLGYVGLPLVIRFCQEKFKVMGFDIDDKKCNNLNNGKSYINHIPSKTIKSIIKENFFATTSWKFIKDVDVILICVPTPLNTKNEPDLQYIFSTLESIKSNLKENQLLVLESTTYPGTTEEILAPIIKDKGLLLGKNFYLSYSPEREDPGNQNFSTKSIPKIVSGITKECCDIANQLYKTIVEETVTVSSTQTAEMTKLLENIHRAVNIGLVNEMKIVADKMNIDIFEVISAAATKPFGFTPYYPGPGLGGHCIPIDPFYLTWKAREYGLDTKFIKLAGEINTNMPNWVIKKLVNVLKKNKINIKKSRVLILGMAYKKNVDDLRESPSLVLLDEMIKMGIDVNYNDPLIHKLPTTRKYKYNLKSIDLNEKNIKLFDAVILSTDHDSYDYKWVEEKSKIVIDTRGKLDRNKKNVVPA